MIVYKLISPTVADYIVIDPTHASDYQLLEQLLPIGDDDLQSIVSDKLPISDQMIKELMDDEYPHYREEIYRGAVVRLDRHTAASMIIDSVLGRPFLYDKRLSNDYIPLMFVDNPADVFLHVLHEISSPQYSIGNSLVPSNWSSVLANIDSRYLPLDYAINNGIRTEEELEIVMFFYLNYPYLLPEHIILQLLSISTSISYVPALSHPSENVVNTVLTNYQFELEDRTVVPTTLESLKLPPSKLNLAMLFKMAVAQTKYYIETRGVDLWFKETTIPAELKLVQIVDLITSWGVIVSDITSIVGLPLVLFNKIINMHNGRQQYQIPYPAIAYIELSEWSSGVPRLMSYSMTVPHNQLKKMVELKAMKPDYYRYNNLLDDDDYEEDYDY